MRLFRRRGAPEPEDAVLIVGLGNPGGEYADTRHNVGFMVVDALAARLGMAFRDLGHCSLADNGSLYGRRVHLAKPMTYMNRSGQPVRGLLKGLGLGANSLLVVHDELDLAFGRIRVKRRGGDAGHRGIRSILDALGTGEFVRVRVGIGRGARRGEETDHVLSPFTAAERRELGEVIGQAVDRIDHLVRGWDFERNREHPEGEETT